MDAAEIRARTGKDWPGTTVTFICHDGFGNFLFNFRGKNARDENFRWDTGAGGLDFGDTILQTLLSEVKQEYGVEPLLYQYLGYRDLLREEGGVKTHWTAHDFKVLVDREKVINGEPHKFDKIGWFRLDNLPSPLHSQFHNLLEKYGPEMTPRF